MPGTENLASMEGLVRSWTLAKNLLPPSLCWTSVLPSCILKLILIPTEKRSYHPSSKKPLFKASGNITENRSWMDTRQGSTDREKPSLKGYKFSCFQWKRLELIILSSL